MNKDLNYYMNLPYRIEVVEDKEEGGFALRCPELNGCVTAAPTIEEGFRLLEDAKREWFSACLEDGIAIPEPARAETVFADGDKLTVVARSAFPTASSM